MNCVIILQRDNQQNKEKIKMLGLLLYFFLYAIGSICALRCFNLIYKETFDIYTFFMNLTEIIISGAIYFIFVIWLFRIQPTIIVIAFFVGGFIVKFRAEHIKNRH